MLTHTTSSAINLTLGPGLFGVHGSVLSLHVYRKIFLTYTNLGASHRRQRKMLNPVFSIKHMRELTPIFYEVAHRVRLSELRGSHYLRILIASWVRG